MRSKDGAPSLCWIVSKKVVLERCGLSAAEYDAHVREWPGSKQGRLLLDALRWGARHMHWHRHRLLALATGVVQSLGTGAPEGCMLERDPTRLQN